MSGNHAALVPAELAEAFGTAGFVSIPGFLDQEELAELRSDVERVIRDVVPLMPVSEVYREDVGEPASLKQLQRLHAHDPALHESLINGPLARLAEILLGEPAAPQNLQLFDKAPGNNRPTPPHQDGAYFPIVPMNAVTIWLALEDVGVAQGCMRYVRGSHECGLRRHERSATLGFSREIVDFDAMDLDAEVALPCEAGQALAHHALTIHRATGNASRTRSRRALGFIYYGASCAIDERAHDAYQRHLAGELRQQGRLSDETKLR